MPSLHHTFDIDLATIYGIEEAVLIHHFQHWIRINKRRKVNLHEGRTWSYQSLQEIADHFPYMTVDSVRGALDRLCKGHSRKSPNGTEEFEPVLLKGNFNKTPFDRTTWYAFVNEDVFLNNLYVREFPKSVGEHPKSKQDIPEPIPDTRTDSKNTSSSPTPPIPPKPNGVPPLSSKQRMKEKMTLKFGEGFTDSQFESAWEEFTSTPAGEIRSPDGYMSMLLDKWMMCTGETVPIIDIAERDRRVERHKQQAIHFASENVKPSELTVMVKAGRGWSPIPYDLEDDEWQKLTRGFCEKKCGV